MKITGLEIKKLLASLQKEGWGLMEEDITLKIKVSEIADDAEIPIDFLPLLKHKYIVHPQNFQEAYEEYRRKRRTAKFKKETEND